MTLQLLVAAMNKEPLELAREMQLDSDAIVVSQGEHYAYEELSYKGYKIRYFAMAERGVGLSRNTSLLRAEGDIILFADEDIVYREGYEAVVLQEFDKHPEADMLLFNVKAVSGRETYYTENFGRVRWYNCGRYPTYSFAARREKIHKNNITFSLLFGGGAKYSNGEDSLFIRDCLKKGLKIYKVPVTIGEEKERPSTWFQGYNEKFFFDRGVLFAFLYGKTAWIWALRFVLTKKDMFRGEIGKKQAYRLICDGIRQGMKEKRA